MGNHSPNPLPKPLATQLINFLSFLICLFWTSIKTDSYNTWCFVTDFFPLTWCFQDSSMLYMWTHISQSLLMHVYAYFMMMCVLCIYVHQICDDIWYIYVIYNDKCLYITCIYDSICMLTYVYYSYRCTLHISHLTDECILYGHMWIHLTLEQRGG